MRKIIVDGKEIMTNYGEKSAERLVVDNDLPNYEKRFKGFRESDEVF